MSTHNILTRGGFTKISFDTTNQHSDKVRLYYLHDLTEESINKAKEAVLRELEKQCSYQGELETFETEVKEKSYLLKQGKTLHLIKGEYEQTLEGARYTLCNLSQATYNFLSHVDVGRSIKIISENPTLNINKIVINTRQAATQQKPPHVLEQEVIASLKKLYQADNTLKLLLNEKRLPFDSMYTSLALITEKEQKEKLEEIRKGSVDSQIPTYESIFLPKEPIALEEIFKHPHIQSSLKKRILVQGSAGMGKSTLCRYIAYCWSQGKMWPEFKAVFLVKFRNLAEKRYSPHENHTLMKVLEHEYGPNSKIDSKTLELLFSDQNFKEKCLLILDGYDEFSSPDLELWCENQRLPVLEAFQKEFSHILITTRPQEVRGFEKNLDLEILGFDREGITRYIDRFFCEEKQEEKKALHSYLQAPLVYSLCHIPLNLEIFCSLVEQGKATFLNSSFTITTIYKALTEWLIERFGKERLSVIPLIKNTSGKKISIKNFTERVLERIAWEMMSQNTLYISLKQVQDIVGCYFADYADLNIEIEQIGPFRIDDTEGHFIHLTFQEFFAAKYLAKGLEEGKREEMYKILAEKKFHPRYQLVMQMLAGLLSEEKIQDFFERLYAEPHDLAEVAEQVLLAKCFGQCREPRDIQQYDTFIQKMFRYLQNPLVSIDLKFEMLNGNSKILNHSAIVQCLLTYLKHRQKEALSLLEKLSKENNIFPEQIFQALVSCFKESYNNKYSIALILGQIAQEGGYLAKQRLKELISLFTNPKVDGTIKRYTGDALRIAMQGKGSLSEEDLKEEIDLLTDLSTDNDIISWVAEGLGRVVQGGGILPQKALEGLVSLLTAPNRNSKAKSSATWALRQVAKTESSLPKEALKELIFLLTDPKVDSGITTSAAEAVMKIAQRENFLPEEALKSFISLLADPEATPATKRYAAEAVRQAAQRGDIPLEKALKAFNALLADCDAYPFIPPRFHVIDPEESSSPKHCATEALAEIAQSKSPLAKQAMDNLISFVTNPKGAYDTKLYSVYALGEIAQRDMLLPKEAIEALSSLLNDPQEHWKIKRCVVEVLSQIAKGKSCQAEEALNILTSLLTSPQIDNFAKYHTLKALEKIAQEKSLLSQDVLKGSLSVLADAKLDSETKRFAANILGTFAKKENPYAEQARKAVSSLFANAQTNLMSKCHAADVLSQFIKAKGAFCEQALQELTSPFLIAHEGDYDTQCAAAWALSKPLQQRNKTLPERVVKGLISLLNDSRAGQRARSYAALALAQVAKKEHPLLESIVQGISSLLAEAEGPNTKGSCAKALEELAHERASLSEDSVKGLISLLKGHQGNYLFTEDSAVEALREVVKTKGSLAEQALRGLISLLPDPQVSHNARHSSAQALVKIIQEGDSLLEKTLEKLYYLATTDEQEDDSLRDTIFHLLQKINFQSYCMVCNTSPDTLKKICAFLGKALYQWEGKYYVADQGKIIEIKEDRQFKIDTFYSAIRSPDPKSLETLKRLHQQVPGLITEILEKNWISFHVAVAYNKIHVLDWLDKQCPGLLLKYCEEDYLLHLAASQGHLEVGKWLFGNKALPHTLVNLLDAQGNTPYDIAKQHNQTDFANWLESVGGKQGKKQKGKKLLKIEIKAS